MLKDNQLYFYENLPTHESDEIITLKSLQLEIQYQKNLRKIVIDENQNLTKKIDKLESDLRKVKDQINQENKKNEVYLLSVKEQLNQSIIFFKKEIEIRESKMSRLENQIKKDEESIQYLKSQIINECNISYQKELMNQKNEYEFIINKLNKEYSSLKNDRDSRYNKYLELESTLGNTVNQLDSMSKENGELRKKINWYESEFSHIKQMVLPGLKDRFLLKLNNKNEEIKDLNEKLNFLENKNTNSINRIDKEASEKMAWKDKYESVVVEKDQWKNKIHFLSQELNKYKDLQKSLSHELELATATQKTLSDELEEWKLKQKITAQELNQIETQMIPQLKNTFSLEIDKYKTEEESLLMKYSQLEYNYQDLLNSFEQSNLEKKDLAQKLILVEEEIINLKCQMKAEKEEFFEKMQLNEKNLKNKEDHLKMKFEQIQNYLKAFNQNKNMLAEIASRLAEQLSSSCVLNPLNDFLELTIKEAQTAEVELKTTPLLSPFRSQLEKKFEKLIDQKNFLQNVLNESYVQIQEQIHQVNEIAHSDILESFPPPPAISQSSKNREGEF